MFANHLNIKLIPFQKDHPKEAEATIDILPYFGQPYDVVHGGILYSLADTLCGYLVWNNAEVGTLVTTIEMKINYISAVPLKGYLRAMAELKHRGKRTAVCVADIFHVDNGKEKLVGIATATFSLIIDKK